MVVIMREMNFEESEDICNGGLRPTLLTARR